MISMMLRDRYRLFLFERLISFAIPNTLLGAKHGKSSLGMLRLGLFIRCGLQRCAFS